MAKLQDGQFIQIKIDGSEIKGGSEESDYKDWLEGFSGAGLQTSAGPDGVYFHETAIDILVTKESNKLYESYLKRGYKNINITIVRRGSDKYGSNYEIQRTEYTNCKFHALHFMTHTTPNNNQQQFMHLTFSCEGTVAFTQNVPNEKEDGLDKVGPVTYSIPEKTLK